MTKIRALIMMVVLGLLSACSGGVYRDTATPMQPQANFAPERYLGRWYEIARYPVSFQEGCTATTADYGAIDASTVSVRNTCRQDSPNGPARSIDGTASIVGPGQLKIRFSSVPFIAADYWVLWVDDNYETAVVGVPSGRAGWILARNPEIDPARRARAEEILLANGYDTSGLIEVPHATTP